MTCRGICVMAVWVAGLAGGAATAMAQPCAQNMGTGEQRKVASVPGVAMIARAQFGGGCTIPDFSKELDAALDEARPHVSAAYRFFVRGKHPYRRFLRYLDPDRRDDGMNEPSRDAHSAVVELDGVQVELFVKDQTPREVLDKLAFDFVLAQASNPGFFEHIDRYQHDQALDPIAALYGQSYYTFPAGDLARVVAFAALHPRAWAALAAARDQVDPHDQRSVEHSAGLVRLRALDRAMHGRRIGAALIEEAAATWEGTQNLLTIAYVSSDLDRDDLKTLFAAFDTAGVADTLAGLR